MASKILSTVNLNEQSSAESHGSCLCGTVKYSIIGQPRSRVLCHCISCKKSSGSSFMANEFYQRKQVKIQDPTSSLKTYSDTSPDSGGTVDRSFCSSCGSNVVVTNKKHPEAIIVMTGTLDDEKIFREWKPEVEFYCKRQSQWLHGVGADEGNKFDSMT